MSKYFFRTLKFILISLSIILFFIFFSLLWNYLNGDVLPNADHLNPVSTEIYDDRYTDHIKKAKNILKQRSQKFHAPGYSISVGVNNEVVWSEVYGYANLENQSPLTIRSKFPIGSLSKPLTATATMKLCEDGVIDLQTDICNIVPEFPKKPYKISLEHLLSHRSGIRHYHTKFKWPPPYFTIDLHVGDDFSNSEQRLGLFSHDSLLFQPGTEYSYSTFGYTLVGEAMAKAANVNFLDLMDALIFEPLGMSSTGADYIDKPVSERVTSYNKTIIGKRVEIAPDENCSYKWAGGGFLSTSTDLAKFGLALMNGQIIKDSSFKSMLRPISPYENSPFPQFHGMGWNFYKLASGNTLVNHGGSPTGGQASMVMIPEAKVVVVILTNSYIYGALPLKMVAAKIAQEFGKSLKNNVPDK
ncbi:beta-lactamase family protein [Hyunsoonleella sp. SJ7]|uniref:Beta-lactamase family protein n=1 Tax=Hyunsoonleella aquatilis TaxID=2762758 RepID=A0A923HDH0_9FLAO|nr:serine hydrolase domain-containing protein [Hyunsoonleella aquatilis]MBC3759161.1 beta-lactamase family protein [Hyunsoonleella aquatilis]